MTAVLGVYTGHDPGACLLVDGRLVSMIEEERLTRFKHGLPKSVRGLWSDFNGRFGYFPWASLTYCLRAGGLTLEELDGLVLSEDADATAMIEMLPIKDRSKVLVSREPRGGAHHFRHALTAFWASPFERAAVLVIDGDGTVTEQGYEAESGYLFTDRQGAWRDVFKNRYPLGDGLRAGLGWAYEYVSALLGFSATRVGYLGEPGKTMGLAPFGQPSPELETPWFVSRGFQVDFTAFHDWLLRTGNVKRLRFDTTELALIQDERAIPADARDLAWKVQAELERAMLHLVQELHRATGAERLCLAGGVALNSVANGLVATKGPFREVYIQPAAADNGQAMGLAFHGHLMLQEQRAAAARVPIAPVPHAFGGRSYEHAAVGKLLEATGLQVKELASDQALAEDAAEELSRGRFLGWFQGGSEYGPRALGHRSILADPRGPQVKDHLNARVKFREGFRPFAPSVLAEQAGEVFELEGESPYMLLVVPVREAWRERVPAITHVDGTARVQTVQAGVDPLYHALISAFARRTGVPLVLNTSFNLRGMPIVESPHDALQCFLFTDMDALYLGRWKVLRPDPARLFPSAAPGWRFVAENRLAWGGQSLLVRYEREAEGHGKTVELRPVPELIQLCSVLDGRTSLLQGLRGVLGGEPAPDVVAASLEVIQRLLRAGAMQLRVGAVVL